MWLRMANCCCWICWKILIKKHDLLKFHIFERNVVIRISLGHRTWYVLWYRKLSSVMHDECVMYVCYVSDENVKNMLKKEKKPFKFDVPLNLMRAKKPFSWFSFCSVDVSGYNSKNKMSNYLSKSSVLYSDSRLRCGLSCSSGTRSY